MRLKSLSLRGALGLRAYGDEIEIDYSLFDPGTIAIVAPNGGGKTTILENSHPWPTLVSRNGSLSNHFHLRDSHKILSFEYAGHEYLSKTLIDAQNGKMEAYLYQDGQPLNDGKIPGYKKAVDELFGSPFVFFKSVFAGQNAEKISQLTPGTKKEFFIGLLGLDRYERLAESAKGKAAGLTVELANVQGKLSPISNQIAENENRLSERAGIEETIGAINIAIANLESEITTLAQQIKEAEANEAQLTELQNRIVSINTDIQSLKEESGALETKKAAEIALFDEKISALMAESDKLKSTLAEAENIRSSNKRLTDLRLEQTRLSTEKTARLSLESDIAKIAHAIELDRGDALAELKTSESRLSLTVSNERNTIANHRQALMNEKLAINARLGSESDAMRAKLENARERYLSSSAMANGMKNVPCKDTQSFVDTCPLLASARKALAELIPAEQLISDLEAQSSRPLTDPRLSEIDAELVKLSDNPPIPASLNSLALVQRQIKDFTTTYTNPKQSEVIALTVKLDQFAYDADRHKTVTTEIVELAKTDWPGLISELDKAEASLEEKGQSIRSLFEQKASTLKGYDAMQAAIDNKIFDRETTVRQIDEKLTSMVSDDIGSLRAAMGLADMSLGQRRTDLGLEQGKIIALDKLAAETENLKTQLAQYEDSEKSIKSDLADWKLLESAFGKNGLQALELDAAGPAISGIATEMIQAFGREWAISISTVRRSADGKKDVETFDIIVSTPKGIRNFEDLSGGEKIWVEESLRKAITIYLINNSGRDYKTLYQDEVDGPLDPERAQAFLDTSFRAHQLTGAHQTVIITQRPEIWQRIPQRIHLDPAKGSIEMVREG